MTTNDLYTLKPTQIIMYSVDWCPDCRRAKSFFQHNNIAVHEVNVDRDERGASFVREINSGNRIVPTIVFPDGEVLVEPSNEQLVNKFGL